ncbi:MAG TPA: hypothetical protein VFC68_06335 [Treponemataceae bacterium]|nr:hypothetical protein [Treponemataceae bacterium]
MRVLIFHFLDKSNSKHIKIIKNLEAAAINNGHQVTVLNAFDADNFQFLIYEYIAIVTTSSKLLRARLPSNCEDVFKKHGSMSGIKSCSLVVKKGLFSKKMNNLVMKAMEKEGMMIDYFKIIENADHAKVVGKKIG